jgi:hypothetical protein
MTIQFSSPVIRDKKKGSAPGLNSVKRSVRAHRDEAADEEEERA